MKLTIPFVVLTLVIALTYPLCGPALSQDDFWNPPPLDGIKQPQADIEAGGESSSYYVPLNTTMKIAAPAPNATLRGVVEIKLSGLEKGGYAIFRLDDEFAYATAYPYKMRWDTQSAQDGRHIIQITGYSWSGQVTGVTSTTVTVKNQISLTSQGGEIALKVLIQPGTSLTREIEAVSSVSGLGGDTVLPNELLALQSTLFARVGLSVTAMNPGQPAEIRATVRQGSLTSDTKELPFEEKGLYGIYLQSASGLAMPPSADSRRPRMGLAEISLEFPSGKIAEGTTWVAPMRVITDLVQRNSIQVTGTHVFEGIWWMQNRKCARIASNYEINEVALVQPTVKLPESPMNPLPSAPDFSQSGLPSLFSSLPGLLGDTGDQNQPMAAPPGAPMFGAGPSTVAHLTNLSGTRTTWLDIEKGVVVRTEDDLTGTLVLPSSNSAQATDAATAIESIPVQQRLPYNLSFTTELVK